MLYIILGLIFCINSQIFLINQELVVCAIVLGTIILLFVSVKDLVVKLLNNTENIGTKFSQDIEKK